MKKTLFLAENQLNEAQAIAFLNTGDWQKWDKKKLVEFQLFQELLCIDYESYTNYLSQVLQRPIMNAELSNPFQLQTRFIELYGMPDFPINEVTLKNP